MAEEFQLKGLTSSQSENVLEKDEQTKQPRMPKLKTKCFKPELQATSTNNNDMNSDASFEKDNTNIFEVKSIVSFDTGVMNMTGDMAIEELQAKKMSMIERVDDGVSNWRCKLCGKTTRVGTRLNDMKKHTETHIEGASYPYKLCGKSSRSSLALKIHMSVNHRK